MQIKPIKSRLIKPGSAPDLIKFIEEQKIDIHDGSILVVSSKVVSICEGSYFTESQIDRDDIIKQEATYYLDKNNSKYGTTHTIVHGSLMRASGIDSSNGNGHYILWPKDPLSTAKNLYIHFKQKQGLTNFGIIITDSVSIPLRIGAIGTSIAHYGFNELNDYRHKKDLFGQEMHYSQANVAEGLAASAVLAMGEGTEQTPLALISDVKNVVFDENSGGSCYNNPQDYYKNDVFEPFWNAVDWQPGGKFKQQ